MLCVSWKNQGKSVMPFHILYWNIFLLFNFLKRQILTRHEMFNLHQELGFYILDLEECLWHQVDVQINCFWFYVDHMLLNTCAIYLFIFRRKKWRNSILLWQLLLYQLESLPTICGLLTWLLDLFLKVTSQFGVIAKDFWKPWNR